jgi:hypothetical protein
MAGDSYFVVRLEGSYRNRDCVFGLLVRSAAVAANEARAIAAWRYGGAPGDYRIVCVNDTGTTDEGLARRGEYYRDLT